MFFGCAALDLVVGAGQAWRAGGGLPPPPSFSSRLEGGRRWRRLCCSRRSRRTEVARCLFLFFWGVVLATGCGWWRARPSRRFPVDVSKPPFPPQGSGARRDASPLPDHWCRQGQLLSFLSAAFGVCLHATSVSSLFFLCCLSSRRSPGPRRCRAPVVFDPLQKLIPRPGLVQVHRLAASARKSKATGSPAQGNPTVARAVWPGHEGCAGVPSLGRGAAGGGGVIDGINTTPVVTLVRRPHLPFSLSSGIFAPGICLPHEVYTDGRLLLVEIYSISTLVAAHAREQFLGLFLTPHGVSPPPCCVRCRVGRCVVCSCCVCWRWSVADVWPLPVILDP